MLIQVHFEQYKRSLAEFEEHCVMTSKLSNDNVEYKARQHPLTVQGTIPRAPEGVEGEGLEGV